MVELVRRDDVELDRLLLVELGRDLRLVVVARDAGDGELLESPPLGPGPELDATDSCLVGDVERDCDMPF